MQQQQDQTGGAPPLISKDSTMTDHSDLSTSPFTANNGPAGTGGVKFGRTEHLVFHEESGEKERMKTWRDLIKPPLIRQVSSPALPFALADIFSGYKTSVLSQGFNKVADSNRGNYTVSHALVRSIASSCFSTCSSSVSSISWRMQRQVGFPYLNVCLRSSSRGCFSSCRRSLRLDFLSFLECLDRSKKLLQPIGSR
jgi:hypothetical protein